MPTTNANDTQLYYERSGNGPVLLFIHGMAGDARVWEDQVRRLSPEFTCVAYDRRGHTRSPQGRLPDSIPVNADDAAALIEALGIAGCLVVASSGGAVIATELLRRHSELLKGAVLSEPPLSGLDPDASRALMSGIRAAVEPAAETAGPEAAVDAFFGAVCPGLWSRADEIHKDRYRANHGAFFATLQAPPYEVSARDLAEIELPVLVLAGTESHPSLRAIAHCLADRLPNGRLQVLDGSGHVTYAERPAAFADAVGDFARRALGSDEGSSYLPGPHPPITPEAIHG
jgi:3-oxoadipate enol-lactonase